MILQTVYADLLFLINFSMDYLCLFLVSKILFRKFSFLRAAASAVIGGIYSVAMLFIPISGISAILSHLLCCVLMNITAFSRKEDGILRAVSNTTIYILSSTLLGGIMTAAFNLLNQSGIDFDSEANDLPPWLLLSTGAVSVLIAIIGGRRLRSSACTRRIELTVDITGRPISLLAMCDSGNLLRDCVGGRPVIVVDKRHCKAILGVDVDLSDPCGLCDELARRVLLIPCSTASGSKTLTAFRPQKVCVNAGKGKSCVDAVVAFAALDSAASCDALIPPELL